MTPDEFIKAQMIYRGHEPPVPFRPKAPPSLGMGEAGVDMQYSPYRDYPEYSPDDVGWLRVNPETGDLYRMAPAEEMPDSEGEQEAPQDVIERMMEHYGY